MSDIPQEKLIRDVLSSDVKKLKLKAEVQTRFGTSGVFVLTESDKFEESIGWLAPPDSLAREQHINFCEALKNKLDGFEFVYE